MEKDHYKNKQDDILIEVLERLPVTPLQKPLPLFDPAIKGLRQFGRYTKKQRLIFLENTALDVMLSHTKEHAKTGEVGGLLIGGFYVDRDINYTWIQAALPAEQSHSRRAALEFTPDAIELVEQTREKTFPKARSVGWYHSHPNFGIFLSGTDIHTHQTVFNNGPFVAIVLDPVRNEYGIFDWISQNSIEPVSWWIVERK
jgi:proteasome lid subunit RPN8/RPN11